MTTLELALGAATLALAVAVVVLALRGGGDGDAAVDPDAVEQSVQRAVRDSALAENAALIEDRAAAMRDLHDDLETMLRTPHGRGDFGEVQLETILADALPNDAYGVREAVLDGVRPDAHVETPDGVLAIDSKFPLEAYERAVTAREDDEAARHEREFARHVEDKLDKIATDYVRPAEGTTDVAFAFVPSEAVYHHLVTEEWDLLREYADRGVHVVSPLTLAQKLRLVRAGVHAQRLSAEAEAVRDQLQRLAEQFGAVEEDWSTAVGHVRNAADRVEDADREFAALRSEFERIDRLEGEE